VFSVLLPHAPLLNNGLGNRFVIYPYYGPLLPKVEPGLPIQSVLPNPPFEVHCSWAQGVAPKLAPHPYNDYSMGYAARNFVPVLPHWNITGGLAGYLTGEQKWAQFWPGTMCRQIFSEGEKSAVATKKMLHRTMGDAWECMEDYIECFEPQVKCHAKHETLDPTCQLCLYHQHLPDDCWWHTSEAARHVIKQCTCDRCNKCKAWGHISQTNGCHCPRCTPMRM